MSSAFKEYQKPLKITKERTQRLLKSLTNGLISTFKQCSTSFTFKNQLERRLLTIPPETKDGTDNLEGNLLIFTNDIINDRYIVKDMLGCGTFGQVCRCEDTQTKKHIALKVIKNKTAYHRQGAVEVKILDHLMKEDMDDKHHIVRMEATFLWKDHLCIVFELLSINLYELLKQNRFQGITLNTLSVFAKQILQSLALLQKLKIIHCDLKPENILIEQNTKPKSLLKIIDFGSACFEQETIYTYIQSRFYRSPEVILGMSYDLLIDIWSFGCICAELYLGLPLFPGVSEYNLLARIIEMLGDIPPYILDQGKNATKYYNKIHCGNQIFIYQLKTQDEVGDKKEWKRYFKDRYLEDLVMNKIFKGTPEDEREIEKQKKLCFVDFLKGILQFDPKKRWTAEEALAHPFITQDRFTQPYVPYRQRKPSTPRGYVTSNSPRDFGVFPIYGTPTSGSYPNKFPESPMTSSGKWFGTSPKSKVSPRGGPFPNSPYGGSGILMSPRDKTKDEYTQSSGGRKSSIKGNKTHVKKTNLEDDDTFGLMFEETYDEKKEVTTPINIKVEKDKRSSGSFKGSTSSGSFSEDKRTSGSFKTNPIPISKHEKK